MSHVDNPGHIGTGTHVMSLIGVWWKRAMRLLRPKPVAKDFAGGVTLRNAHVPVRPEMRRVHLRR